MHTNLVLSLRFSRAIYLPRASCLPQDEAGNVFATDTILAHLMASPRTVFPWDIVATYLPGGIIFLGACLA